jgi:hypothetical protein
MHPVLNVEQNRRDLTVSKAAEERNAKSCCSRMVAFHPGPQLLVITNENQMPDAKHKRNEYLGLGSLTCFIHDELVKTKARHSGAACMHTRADHYLGLLKCVPSLLPIKSQVSALI